MVQAVDSGTVGGFSGRGFSFNFERQLSPGMIDKMLHGEAVAIRSASIEAVVTTTNEIKLRLRNYITAHFTGSEMHGNNQRRVANAASQSKFYDDVDGKGQYTGLIYSKFGAGMGAGGFIDFLLLHARGGTVKPKTGPWLFIPNAREFGAGRRNTGFFPMSKASVFWAKSADGRKLFMLRRQGNSGPNRAAQKVELLATLVKTLVFRARLTGLDEISRSRGELFESNFTAGLDARGVGKRT